MVFAEGLDEPLEVGQGLSEPLTSASGPRRIEAWSSFLPSLSQRIAVPSASVASRALAPEYKVLDMQGCSGGVPHRFIFSKASMSSTEVGLLI